MSTMLTLDDDRINEASALAFSRTIADLAYTCNDEDGQGYAIRPSTGETVGTFRAKGITLDDPEAMSVDFKGDLWWADIGDNSAVREWVNLYRRGEPGLGNRGSLKFTHYRLKYPGGTAHNAEAFVTFPNGDRFIISKEASGTVYKLPATLKVSPAFNTMTSVATGLPSFISDAVVSKDGLWVFALRQGQPTTIYVLNSSTWVQVDTISMTSMDKPEGIAIAPNGRSLLTVDDNSRQPNGKLQTGIKITGTYCPAGSTTYDDGTTITGAPAAAAAPTNPCA